MNCECANWARVEEIDLCMTVDCHHSCCPKFASEVRPRLFYFEEGCDGWVPAPDEVESIIDATSHFAGPDDDVVEIRFKRVDLTDKQYSELPEAG